MQSAVPIVLSEKDFNHIRSLFPEEAAGTIDRQSLEQEISKFWYLVRHAINTFKSDVVAITSKGQSLGVIASKKLVQAAEDIQSAAIEVFKRACELLRHEEVTAIGLIGPNVRIRLIYDWMRHFGVSLA